MFEPSVQSARYVRTAGIAILVVAAAMIIVYAGYRLGVARYLGRVSADLLPQWIIVSTIIFAAATLSSVVGFAFSAIAGAMILHFVPNGVEAVEIMMIASIGIQCYSVAGIWRSIQWSRCTPFIVGGIAALPLGISLLLRLKPESYASAMGAMLVAYGVYMLLRRPLPCRSGEHRIADGLIGALGGITGPLAAFPGALVTIWCGTRKWSKVEQRAVYQPYILIMQILALAALCFVQGRTMPDARLLAYALPGIAGATIGLRVFHALTDGQFQKIVNVALVVSGLALALK